jgi:hypothetical protein
VLAQALEQVRQPPSSSARSVSPPPLNIPRSNPIPIRGRRGSVTSLPSLPSPVLRRSPTPSPPSLSSLVPDFRRANDVPPPVVHSALSSSAANVDDEIRVVNDAPSSRRDARRSLLNPHLQVARYGAVNDVNDEEPVRGRKPVTGQNVLDFATANTPGPITGVSGAANAVSSVLNPPTTNVRSGFANSRFVNTMAPLSRGATATSAATNVATGLADVTGIVSDAVSMHKKGGWSRFWGGLKANFRNPFAKPKDSTAEAAEGRSEAKRLLVNTATNATDLGANQIPSAISSVGTLTGHAAPAVLGTVAAGAGMGINSVVAARSLWRGGRAAMHESRVNKLLAENEVAKSRLLVDPENPELTPEMEAAAKHHSEQMNKRKKRSLIGAAGATLGAVGGGLLLGGLLGASMLTPIGWGLAAAGGLVAAGLGAHKLYRWWKKRKEGTLGEARKTHANTIYNAMQQPEDHPDRQSASKLLKARGITPEQLHGDRGEAINLLKRKAEAW